MDRGDDLRQRRHNVPIDAAETVARERRDYDSAVPLVAPMAASPAVKTYRVEIKDATTVSANLWNDANVVLSANDWNAANLNEWNAASLMTVSAVNANRPNRLYEPDRSKLMAAAAPAAEITGPLVIVRLAQVTNVQTIIESGPTAPYDLRLTRYEVAYWSARPRGGVMDPLATTPDLPNGTVLIVEKGRNDWCWFRVASSEVFGVEERYFVRVWGY